MTNPVDPQTGEIDYELAISLDAEDLAEGGIGQAYEELKGELASRGVQPWELVELLDDAAGTYRVACGRGEYPIYGPHAELNSWGLAAFALFDIVNRQLQDSEIRLFALNGGNDLFGIFMTSAQAEHARQHLEHKSDWPYLPTLEPDWYGAFHDEKGQQEQVRPAQSRFGWLPGRARKRG